MRRVWPLMIVIGASSLMQGQFVASIAVNFDLFGGPINYDQRNHQLGVSN